MGMRHEGKRWKTVVQETVDFCQPKMGFCQRHVQWDQHRLWPKFVPLALKSLIRRPSMAPQPLPLRVQSAAPDPEKKIGPGPLKIGTWNPLIQPPQWDSKHSILGTTFYLRSKDRTLFPGWCSQYVPHNFRLSKCSIHSSFYVYSHSRRLIIISHAMASLE